MQLYKVVSVVSVHVVSWCDIWDRDTGKDSSRGPLVCDGGDDSSRGLLGCDTM